VLNIDIRNFGAYNIGKDTEIKWTVTNNEQAANFIIEYSTDNMTFHELTTVNASATMGVADYVYRGVRKANDPAVFYRVKVVAITAQEKFSNTVLIRNGTAIKNTPAIFPNPVLKAAWVSIESSAKTTATIYISDVAGRLIQRVKLPLVRGSNLLALNDLAQQSAGMYIVRIKTLDSDTTQKVMVTK
jgi:hypothetical protein